MTITIATIKNLWIASHGSQRRRWWRKRRWCGLLRTCQRRRTMARWRREMKLDCFGYASQRRRLTIKPFGLEFNRQTSSSSLAVKRSELNCTL